VVTVAYAGALLQVAIGIGLPVLLVLGWDPVVSDWTRFKVTHAWLNLFGFVSLTIIATLVYLYPTIVGARITVHSSLPVLVGGAVSGPPLVALGAILRADAVAIAGGAASLTGAAALVIYVADTWRRRGTWTTDPGWHRAAMLPLTAAVGWYLVAVAAAVAGIVRDGVAPPGWGLGSVTLPLIAGWVLQVLVGAWTHLLPAVAVTEPAQRAAMRQVLGRSALPRLMAWNAGVLLAWIGLATDLLPVTLLGVLAFSAAALLSVGLVAVALLRRAAVSR
jgi:nitrite reductase (NO-forming)